MSAPKPTDALASMYIHELDNKLGQLNWTLKDLCIKYYKSKDGKGIHSANDVSFYEKIKKDKQRRTNSDDFGRLLEFLEQQPAYRKLKSIQAQAYLDNLPLPPMVSEAFDP